jgi:hypothetical protein
VRASGHCAASTIKLTYTRGASQCPFSQVHAAPLRGGRVWCSRPHRVQRRESLSSSTLFRSRRSQIRPSGNRRSDAWSASRLGGPAAATKKLVGFVLRRAFLEIGLVGSRHRFEADVEIIVVGCGAIEFRRPAVRRHHAVTVPGAGPRLIEGPRRAPTISAPERRAAGAAGRFAWRTVV